MSRRAPSNRVKGPPVVWLAWFGGGMHGVQSCWFDSQKAARLFIKGEEQGCIAGPYRSGDRFAPTAAPRQRPARSEEP